MTPDAHPSPRSPVAPFKGCSIAVDIDPRRAFGLTPAQFTIVLRQLGATVHRGARADATCLLSDSARSLARHAYSGRAVPALSTEDFRMVVAGRVSLVDAFATALAREGYAPALPPEPFNWRSSLHHAAEAADAFEMVF